MRYDVYCDESNPDVFWSRSANKARYLCIGALWLPTTMRAEAKDRLRELCSRHDVWQEIKWHKVHARRETFYRDLIDLFLQYEEALRFRCIVVEENKVDMTRFHENDQELGFYKFYYQLLTHWIADGHEYAIFCDEKTNRLNNRLPTLQRVLNNAHPRSSILSVQALSSQEVRLLQMTDFLLGMASTRMNGGMAPHGVKARLIAHLEGRLGRSLLPTTKGERKFNIFMIDLQGDY